MERDADSLTKPITQDYRAKLREIDEEAENLIHTIECVEECNFKQVGLQYHQLRLVMREGPHFPQEKLQRLRQWFDPSDPGYRPVSQFIAEIVHIAQEARRHVILVGTKEELKLRHTAADNLRIVFEERAQHLIDVFDELESNLFDLSEIEREEHGDKMWWEEKRNQYPEWAVFMNWVYTFPETIRLMNVGRSLGDIAIDLLRGRMSDSLTSSRTL